MIRLPTVGELLPLEVAAEAVGRSKRTLFDWIERGWLEPHKVRGDQRTYVESAQLAEAMQKSGRRPRRRSAQ